MRIKEMLEGKMKRYLILGIVEVFLVVAGILIALSINSWDNKRTLRRDELNIYNNILARITEDREMIQGVSEYNNRYLQMFQRASRIISEDDSSQQDTLIYLTLNLSKYSDFHGSSSVYQNLVNSGELKLLHNRSIINRLQELEEIYIYLNRMEDIHWHFIRDIISRELLFNFDFASDRVKHSYNLYSFQFHNLFLASMEIMLEKEEVYQSALRKIDQIARLIEEELVQ